MIAEGTDWKKITELTGHSDVRTTYSRYGKVVPEDLAPAAAQLEEYFDLERARLESRAQAGARLVGQRDGGQAAPTSPERVNESGIDSARFGHVTPVFIGDSGSSSAVGAAAAAGSR